MESDYLIVRETDGMMALKLGFREVGSEDSGRIQLAQDSIHWPDLVRTLASVFWLRKRLSGKGNGSDRVDMQTHSY
jgi:hypothetical protein